MRYTCNELKNSEKKLTPLMSKVSHINLVMFVKQCKYIASIYDTAICPGALNVRKEALNNEQKKNALTCSSTCQQSK